MFSSLALVASSALLLCNALPVSLEERDQPANWWTTGLESYETYHERYMAIGCNSKHNTPFFDQCCHPLLRTETVEKNRPASCNPANVNKGKDANNNQGHHDDNNNGDEDCDDEEQAPAPAPKPAAPAPKPADPPAPKPAAPKPEPSNPPAPPVNAAPAPKPNPPPAPAPPAPAPPAPAPAPANNNPLHTGGFGTWFTQNGVAGACGTVHQDSDHVVALDARTYGNTGQQSPLCGKTIEITDTDTGNTFDGVVADACPTCTNAASVDMSTSLFQLFAPLSKGELNIQWRLKD